MATEVLSLVYRAYKIVSELQQDFDDTRSLVRALVSTTQILKEEIEAIPFEAWAGKELVKEDIEDTLRDSERFTKGTLRRFKPLEDQFAKLCNGVVKTKMVITAIAKGCWAAAEVVEKIHGRLEWQLAPKPNDEQDNPTKETEDERKRKAEREAQMRNYIEALQRIAFHLNAVPQIFKKLEDEEPELVVNTTEGKKRIHRRSILQEAAAGFEDLKVEKVEASQKFEIEPATAETKIQALFKFLVEDGTGLSAQDFQRSLGLLATQKASDSFEEYFELCESKVYATQKEFVPCASKLVGEESFLHGFWIINSCAQILQPFLQAKKSLGSQGSVSVVALNGLLSTLEETAASLLLTLFVSKLDEELQANHQDGASIDSDVTVLSEVMNSLSTALSEGAVPDLTELLETGMDVASQTLSASKKVALLLSIVSMGNLKGILSKAHDVSSRLQGAAQMVQMLQQRATGMMISETSKNVISLMEVLDNANTVVKDILELTLKRDREEFDVRRVFREETEASAFWIKYFGRNVYEVHWGRFAETFQGVYGAVNISDMTQFRTYLVDKRGMLSCVKLRLFIGEGGKIEWAFKKRQLKKAMKDQEFIEAMKLRNAERAMSPNTLQEMSDVDSPDPDAANEEKEPRKLSLTHSPDSLQPLQSRPKTGRKVKTAKSTYVLISQQGSVVKSPKSSSRSLPVSPGSTLRISKSKELYQKLTEEKLSDSEEVFSPPFS